MSVVHLKKKFSMLLISQCLCYQNLHRTLYQPLNVLKKNTQSTAYFIHCKHTIINIDIVYMSMGKRYGCVLNERYTMTNILWSCTGI